MLPHLHQIWDAATGQGFTSIEPPEGGVNDVLVWPGSGLIMVGGDTTRVRGLACVVVLVFVLLC